MKKCKSGYYYCNTDKKCKPIPEGSVLRDDGFLMKETLDEKDKPFVKKLIKNLKKGSKTHEKQAEKLEKAMKENTAIESELVIQDWNSDNIKFTEIETVDIIKAKPLKEGVGMAKPNVSKQLDDMVDKKILDAYEKGDIKPRPSVKPKPKKPLEVKNKLKDHYDWREELGEDWQKVNRKDKTDGLSKKAVKAYRRENPGSKLQTAVTTKPSKLKKGSKSAKRRLSFCRRMKGMKKKLTSAKTRRDPDSRINKALRRWNC